MQRRNSKIIEIILWPDLRWFLTKAFPCALAERLNCSRKLLFSPLGPWSSHTLANISKWRRSARRSLPDAEVFQVSKWRMYFSFGGENSILKTVIPSSRHPKVWWVAFFQAVWIVRWRARTVKKSERCWARNRRREVCQISLARTDYRSCGSNWGATCWIAPASTCFRSRSLRSCRTIGRCMPS